MTSSLLISGNEEEYGDPLQPNSNSEDEVGSFSMGKAGETIWFTLTLRKRIRRTSQGNIVTHLPGVGEGARVSQISRSFSELSMSNDMVQWEVNGNRKEAPSKREVERSNSVMYNKKITLIFRESNAFHNVSLRILHSHFSLTFFCKSVYKKKIPKKYRLSN